MNVNVQEVINAILKALHPSVFQTSMNAYEKEVERKLNGYNLHTNLNVRLQNDEQRNTVLTWYSHAQKTIACRVDEIGFMFSEIGVFEDGMILDIHLYFNSDPEIVDIIKVEVDEIKSLLKMMSPGIETYFN